MKSNKFLTLPAPVLRLAALLACASFSGCIVVNTDTTMAPDKNGAPREQFKFDASLGAGPSEKTVPEKVDIAAKSKQIELGKSKDFILGLLGEPKEKITEDGGAELWKWNYTETHTTMSSFVVLYTYLSVTDVEKTRFVEFKDGVVAKTWIQ